MKKRHCLFPLAAAVLAVGLAAQTCADEFDATTATVGHETNGLLVTPVNQIVSSAGQVIELPGMRPQALALSPDGKILATAGRTHELVILDPATGKIRQRPALPSDKVREPEAVSGEILKPDNRAQLSFTGLVFSPDGSRIYLSNVNGDIKVFGVDQNHQVSPLFSIALPPATAPGRKEEIPAGLAVSRDGKRLYVALNLSNRLAELDAVTGQTLRVWDVGVAPFDVVLGKNKAYVSNWGGRRPGAGDVTGPAGRGTLVRVDDRSIADEGSVSVVDLTQAPTVAPKEIVLGRRTCALALSPDGRWLVAACAGDDTLNVLDTRTDKIVEKISARQNPGDLFGAQPNALAFADSGKKLLVANGTQNAVAVFQFKPGKTKMLGLIPAGWFPAALAFDAGRRQICVANVKDIAHAAENSGFNTHQYCGTLSLVPLPPAKELAVMTQKTLAQLRYPLLAQAKLPPRPDRAPAPVPERVGEPSVFRHVIYIIKENRTYDQILGDVSEGNGNPKFCNFGEHVTPNQHKLVREFALLDNTYCSGILSADGHNWAGSGIATDYLERSYAGWPRSYPSGGDKGDRDALAYSPAGFIWDNALAHGRTMRNFGEFTSVAVKRWKDPARKGRIGFTETWNDYITGANAIEYASEPDLESLRPVSDLGYIGWDLSIPDQWRASYFIRAFQQLEANDSLPQLTIIWLPNDHTSGTGAGAPTPAAQVADNDLAFGRIVEAISHSRYWKDTCIFAIEDDPQDGWDHVSGYRTTAYVISPYTKRRAVVSTQYNQTSLLRTMELILGLPPMNQMDATATPMFDCFTNTPDFTPFVSVLNNVPLDQMNPDPKKIADAQQRRDALASAKLPLTKADQCSEDVFNRILWRATMGREPYPEWAVRSVDDDD